MASAGPWGKGESGRGEVLVPHWLGQTFRGGPHCTHTHLHPNHSPCSLSQLHRP